MARKAAETASVEAAAFTVPDVAAAQEQIRTAVESGVAQWKTGVEKLQASVEKNSAVVTGAVEALTANARSIQDTMLEAAKANAAAAMSFTTELLKVRTLSDVFELQASHARKAMEAFLAQGKEIAAIAQKSANDLTAKAKEFAPAA